MERCTVKVCRRFLTAKFMSAITEITNLMDQENACIVMEPFKKVNSKMESTMVKVEKLIKAYLDRIF